MSSTVYSVSAVITAVASGEIPKFSRVKEVAVDGVLAVRVASNTEAADGVSLTEVSDGTVSVKFLSGADTNFGIASAAIAIGAPVYAAATGKLAATGTAVEGYARQAAAAGDVFEWRSKPVPASET